MAATGGLTIVGTGISIGQITLEAVACVDDAERLFAIVSELAALRWLEGRNASAESLHRFYAEGKPRSETYAAIVEYVLAHVVRGSRVCLVLYGHPGVFATPAHELIRRCRSARVPARMLPGVSAEDCLFADLGVDPGSNGCQSYEATDFLLRRRRIDPTVPLVLWQFGVTGVLCHQTCASAEGVRILAKHLGAIYGPRHPVTIYEAAIYPLCPPVAMTVELQSLHRRACSAMSTLFVPPLKQRRVSSGAVRELGLVAGRRPFRPTGVRER